MNTNTLSDRAWLSAHLFYNAPWEHFLRHAVTPVVEEILSNQLAEQFFFIRYWEKGPHVRLRFKGNLSVLENTVKPMLGEHFSNYFAAHPSVRADPAWLNDLPEDSKWFPNNSVQFIGYEQETERYGGRVGLLLSERQFKVSSRAVLSVLKEGDWDYSRALGAAIQMHIGFAFAVGMTFQETARFFSLVFDTWLPRSYFSFHETLSAQELDSRRVEVLESFRQAFEKQKALLLPLFQRTWEALESYSAFDQPWYNEWLFNMRVIGNDLHKAQAYGQLTTSVDSGLQVDSLIAGDKQHVWPIFSSYIHMTNNRLGIMNRDEGYLGFLIKESLAEIMPLDQEQLHY